MTAALEVERAVTAACVEKLDVSVVLPAWKWILGGEMIMKARLRG